MDRPRPQTALASLCDEPSARSLLDRLEESLALPPDPVIEELTRRLLVGREREVAAVLFYGSCLFDQTRTGSSFPDFYLLTDGASRGRRSLLDAALSLCLPPNIYSPCFPGASGLTLRCKVCEISFRQFLEETSPAASDLHHLGRFSKRFAISYARDPAIRASVARASLTAILTLLPHSLALLPERFDLEALVLTQLGLSYRGEQRVVEPDKVRRLFLAARDHYLAIYQAILALRTRQGLLAETSPGHYLQTPATEAARRRTRAFVRRSRIRGVLRWPKYVITVEDWVDYLLDKLERHHGIRLELSERERRHPLIFGWPRLLELRRRGIVS